MLIKNSHRIYSRYNYDADSSQQLCYYKPSKVALFSSSKHVSYVLIPKVPNLSCMLNSFSRVRLCVTPWTAAHQAPLSTGFSRQEYWSGLPLPSPKKIIIKC